MNVSIDRLSLDPQNPRLPQEAQGKSQKHLLEYLFRHFDLEELAGSMSKNGYFDEEPLVAVPQKLPSALSKLADPGTSEAYVAYISNPQTQLVVAEGNRRLATAKILRDPSLIGAPLSGKAWEATGPALADLEVLPVIVYPERSEVLPYLGVRHIVGNKKWDSYAKARYIAHLLEQKQSIEQIEQDIGDRGQSVRRNIVAYNLIKVAEEEAGYDVERAKQNFSLLLLAVGSTSVRRYLGWVHPDKSSSKALALDSIPLKDPIAAKRLPNLRNLMRWLFGEGSREAPAIRESRDITNYLTPVLSSKKATEYLEATGRLVEAYDLSDGEEALLTKLLRQAASKLEQALGLAHRHRTPDVLAQAKVCADNAKQLIQTLRSEN